MKAEENPYEPEDESSVDERDLADLRNAIAGGDEDDAVTVEPGAPVRPDEDEDDGVVEPSRKDRRRERGRKFREEQEAAVEAAREEAARAREELAEMRGRLAAVSQQQAQHQENPYDKRVKEEEEAQLKTVRDYESAVQRAGSNGLSEEERAKWLSRSAAHTRNFARIEHEQAAAQSNTPEARAHQVLSAKYPEVMHNDTARNYATALFQTKQLAGAVTETNRQKVIDEVMAATRRQFKIGDPPPPTDRQRSSYARQSTSTSGRRAGKSHVMTESDKRMAHAYTAHIKDLSDAQRYQMWVNDMGE
jgi:hypothetical protein